MQDQRVRLDHIDGAAALVYRVAIVELDGAQVGKEQQVGRHIAYAKRSTHFAAFDTGTLAAHTHSQALLLRRLGQVAVDQARLFGAAGHRAYQDGRADLLAKDGDAGVDFVQIQFRQRLVGEVILFQPRGKMRELNIFFQVDADMVSFTLVDRQRVLSFF